jgi:AcrR family transcriptional regulator
MPLPRFEKLPEDQKAHLLDAATREFSEHGYEDASLNRIVEAAGISKGTVYYYFSDRDDLYATVVARVAAALVPALDLAAFAPTSADAFWDELAALSIAGARAAALHPESMRALRSFQRTVRHHDKPAFRSILEQGRAAYTHVIETGRRLGCVRDDLPTAQLVALIEAIDETLDRALFEPSTPPSAEALEAHAALMVDLGRRLLEPAAVRRPDVTKRGSTVKKGRKS